MPEDLALTTLWRKSSQKAAELYDGGAKLWKKSDLLDIEQQVARGSQEFTVRSIEGQLVTIHNPMFDVHQPIWRPYVKFQEYWRLVKTRPDGSPDTYHCSYLVDWNNQAARRFRGLMENSSSVFDEKRSSWDTSTSCTLLRSQLGKLLGTRKVTKVICFGLGDMCRQPPEWFQRKIASNGGSLESTVDDSMVQHSIAVTLADVCRKDETSHVQLLAQDPDYTEQTKAILERTGFTIVGNFGAGGFAEIDDSSVVFSVCPEAPVKQIIADVARPAVIITNGFTAFNDHEKPWADADSPRTRQMWQDYESIGFPVAPKDTHLISNLRELQLYVRKAIDTAEG